jgi:transketolase C-terminal domain/subunit
MAANVYLATVDDGGDLELWASGIRDREEYDRTRTLGDYGLDRKAIHLSAVEIKPLQGELIIFDARKIHAVRRINDGVRIAVSCFVGYRGTAAPLTVFS